jgi:HD superfamily phosphohydrolase
MDDGLENSNPWNSVQLFDQLQAAYDREGLSAAWINERPLVQLALARISALLPPSRYSPIDVLGIGGSGIVLRVGDTLFPSVDNALKFPRPLEGQAHVVAEMVANELRFLADLRHPGIVKMLYYRTINDVPPYGKLPFYLMEVVEGKTSSQFLTEPNVSQTMFLKIVQQTAETIQYLHSYPGAPYVHLDIKPQNITISTIGRPVLLDLGTCKRLTDGQDRTILAITQEIAHPALVHMLTMSNGEHGKMIGTIVRREINPQWDLWAFGRTLLLWLGVRFDTGTLNSKAFVERLDPYARKYLFLLAARLLSDSLPGWLIKRVGLHEDFIKSMAIIDARHLVDQIGKLTGSYSPLDLVPELTKMSSGSIQAAPGVHVPNTRRLTQTLEHRLFRRLSSITQLGIVSQIFPSAKHTRREHSLGTYGNVCRMVIALYHDSMSPLFKQLIEAQDIQELMLASLLHDLGQFPLAHDLEDIAPDVFDHEDLTQAMLKGMWRTGKAGSKSIRFESLELIFIAWNTSAARLVSILTAKAKSNNATQKDKLLRSIISGPIDADKLDYLFRDARYTDVPYPNGIDVDRLFRCLTTVVMPIIPGGTTNVPMIGIHAKGKVAAEFMTMARYAMFSQVYWHHAVRAQKAMLSRAVAALLAHANTTKVASLRAGFIEMVCSLPESMYRHSAEPPQLPFENEVIRSRAISNVGVGTDLSATDATVLTWLREKLEVANLPEAQLLQGILTRKLFKRLWVIGRSGVVQTEWDELCKSWDELSPKQKNYAALSFERKIAERLNGGLATDVTTLSAHDALSLTTQLAASHTPWLLIDLPGSKSGSEVGLSYVTESQARRMRKDDRAMGDLQSSSAWEQYARDIRHVAGNVRVFCDERLIETVDESITQRMGFDDLLAVVQAARMDSSKN